MMKQSERIQWFSGTCIGAVTGLIAIVGLTVIGDLYAPLKQWLADIFFHHWIGKGVIGVGLTLLGTIISPIFTATSRKTFTTQCFFAVAFVLVCATIVIIGFYYYEAFIVIH